MGQDPVAGHWDVAMQEIYYTNRAAIYPTAESMHLLPKSWLNLSRGVRSKTMSFLTFIAFQSHDVRPLN